MSRPKSRPNSFNGEARVTAKTSPERQTIEKYLLDNPGKHTSQQIASATGIPLHIVRARLATAVFDGTVVNRNVGHIPAQYQHAEHRRREVRVNSSARVTNAHMENGSTDYWAKHMAQVNEPPRRA